MEKTAPSAEMDSANAAATSAPNVTQPPVAHAPDGAHQPEPKHSGPVPQMETNVNQGQSQPQPPTTYATPLNVSLN